MKKVLSLALVLALLLSTVILSAMAEDADIGPFGYYPETVVIRTGGTTTTDLFDDGFSKAEGLSASGNLYDDYLLERSNIRVENMWMVDNDTYNTRISLGIASGELPDIFRVTGEQTLKMLVDNDLIEDLTGTFESKAAPYIQAFYNDYGDRAFDTSTFDGKLMAVPDLNYGYQFCFVWVRQDWLDQLGMDLPVSLDDCVEIAQAFLDNGLATIGFPCATDVAGQYNAAYMMDPALNTMGAYLRSWMYKDDGSIVYGSIQPEAKVGLAFLADMYERGLIDKEFAVRDWDANKTNLVSGQFGICFGPWYLPDVAMQNMKVVDPESDWVPVLAPLSADGKIHPMDQQIHRDYLCVRKGFEHPEVVWEMINYNWQRGEDPQINEIDAFYEERLGTVTKVAKPWVSIGCSMVQWNNAVPREGKIVQDAINNNFDTTGLSDEMRRFTEASKAWLVDGDASKWYIYSARVEGCLVSSDDSKIEIQSMCYPSFTETMALKWASLKAMEDELIVKIVMGEEPLDAFDTFVENWTRLGGQEITDEINAMYAKNL